MKIILGVVILIGVATNVFGMNMDYVKFYDADRTENDKLETMSKELKLFITSEANTSLISDYKYGELVLNEEELLAQEERLKESQEAEAQLNEVKTNQKETPKVPTEETVQTDEKAGFFARMLEKVGIGSTKKIVQKETKPDKPIETQNELPQNEEIAKPKEEVTNEK